MNIARWETDHVRDFGGRVGLIVGEGVWTNTELHEQAARLARGLLELNVLPGDRVAIVLPNCPALYIASSAAWMAGAIVVVLADGAASEVSGRVRHCGATVLIAGTRLLEQMGPTRGTRRIVVEAGAARQLDCLDLRELVDAHAPLGSPVPRAGEDPAQLCYTSGTTAAPKAVIYTHAGIDAFLRAFAAASSPSRGCVVLIATPPTAFGARLIGLRVIADRTYVLLDRFEPQDVLANIERHRVTELAMVPTMAEQLAESPFAREYDCSSLREINLGGSHVSRSLIDRVKARMSSRNGGHESSLARPSARIACESPELKVLVHYGMTETGGGFATTASGGDGIVGLISPQTDVRIVDDQLVEKARGEVGEIMVRTPYAAVGYWEDPQRTSEVFRNGYVMTGDLGHFTSEGALRLVGRKKDIIIQGGFNIAPQEVVEVVSAIEGVERCAVVGVPNDLLGEEVVACIVVAKGAPLSRRDVRLRCRASLDPRKLPARVFFVEQLPLTAAGKVDAASLRQQIVDGTLASAQTLETAPAQRIAVAPSVRALVEETLLQTLNEDGRPIPDRETMAELTFGDMGLDSGGAVRFAHALGHRLHTVLSPVLPYAHPTVQALSEHLDAVSVGARIPAASAPEQVSLPVANPTVAVVGMGCRLPAHTNTHADFWALLRGGVDATSVLPLGRSLAGETRRGAFIDEIDRFDAKFFRLEAEAADLDPRHRMLLEVTWEALEDAGVDPLKLAAERTGVFLGIYGDRYQSSNFLGTAPGMAVSRLCHFLNLRGPVLSIDTTCSSSLVALHCAVQSLRSGECDTAIVAGANFLACATPTESLGVISPSGRSRTFDASADGFAQGEGCVVLVLRRFAETDANGDRVYASVLATAINHDGRSSSLTAPNPIAQQAVIRGALRSAGIAPEAVQYVEAHGTGTVIGDPIEVEALAQVFGDRGASPALAIGSVKTNIGHLEAAAGLAGVLKVILSIVHRRLPPSLHFQTPNQHIPWDRIPVVVQAQLTEWPRPTARLVAGVSSFGMSGTNAHVVVGEPPREPRPWARASASANEDVGLLLPLSAKTPESLRALASRYATVLEREEQPCSHRDIAYTASCRRSHFQHRLAVVGHTRGEFAAQLRRFAEGGGRTITGRATEPLRDLVMVFSGQGSQWFGMGRELLKREPAFNAAVARCARHIDPITGWSVLDELHADEARSRVRRTDVAQPVLFALQVGLAELWRSWGVEPTVVVGHSLGEVTAAYVAGSMSLPEAAWLVCERGRVMQTLHGGGGMLHVGMSEGDAEAFLRSHRPDLDLAASNGPKATMLSGTKASIARALTMLEANGVQAKLMDTEYAFHSRQVDDLVPVLTAALGGWTGSVPHTQVISAVTGETVSSFDAAYWGAQIRHRVRFQLAATTLLRQGLSRFVEVGPHPVLLSAIGATSEELGAGEKALIGSLRRDSVERDTMLEALAQLYCAGYPVDWKRQHETRARVADLPYYAWERSSHWFDAAAVPRPAGTASETRLVSAAAPWQRYYELALDPDQPAIARLCDQRIRGEPLFGAASFVDLVLEAAKHDCNAAIVGLANARFERTLVLSAAGRTNGHVQAVFDRFGADSCEFAVYSRTASTQAPVRHASGQLLLGERPPQESRIVVQEVRSRCGRTANVEDFYDACSCAGLRLGKSFQAVDEIWTGEREVLARVTSQTDSTQPAGGAFPVGALNAAFLLAAMVPLAEANDREPQSLAKVNPLGIIDGFRKAVVVSRLTTPSWLYLVRNDCGETVEWDASLLASDGAVLVRIDGLRVAVDLSASDSADGLLYETVWKNVPCSSSAAISGTWLLFCDGSGVGEALARQLEARGARTLVATPGDGYVHHDDSRFTLDAHDPLQVGRLFGELAQTPVQNVVCLWALGIAHADECAAHASENLVTLAMRLVQAFADVRTPPSRLFLITRNAQTAGADVTGFAQSSLWGFGRSLARERPELRIKLIDVDSGDPDAIGRLCDELARGDLEEQVALRADERWAPRLARFPAARGSMGFACVSNSQPAQGAVVAPERSCAVAPSNGGLKPDRAYVVTGGLGGLGSVAARCLVDLGARHIVLLGRTPPTGAAIERLTELSTSGQNVVFKRVDVGDNAALAVALTEISDSVSPIGGVIHAAGDFHDGAIDNLDEDAVRHAMAAKVRGSWNLHRLTHDLDFFVLFSSVSGVVGNAGQTNYAAANTFMDALCHYRKARGLAAQSIDWCGWNDVGMAVRSPRSGSAAERITAGQGLAILRNLLQLSATQVTVLTAAGLTAIKRNSRGGAATFYHDLFAERPAAGTKAVENVGDYTTRAAGTQDRSQAVEQFLRAELARFTPTAAEQPRDSDTFSQLGIDSLGAIQLRANLAAQFGLRIPATELRADTTLSRLLDLVTDVSRERPGAQRSGLSQLTWLSSKGTSPPLVFIHPVGGGIACYRAIARALQYPTVAIEAPANHSRIGIAETIQTTAASYLNLLRAEGLRPPFILAGWSLGGLVAFEMAASLAATAQESPLAMLIDTHFLTGVPERDRRLRVHLRRRTASASTEPDGNVGRRNGFDPDKRVGGHSGSVVRDFLLEIAASTTRETDKSLLTQLVAQHESADGVETAQGEEGALREAASMTGLPAAELEKLFAVFRRNTSAMQGYRPSRYEGRTVLLPASSAPEDEWRAFAPNLEIDVLPGDHYSIMEPPALDLLVDRLRHHLRRVVI